MIWHILKKDLLRLRWHIGIAAAALCGLATMDIELYGTEYAGFLFSAVLPLTWAMLIALAMHLEPLTSDDAFWLTRPYRRTNLFAAKLAFALVAIHAPVLVLHCVILAAHGFAPFAPGLFAKQVLLLFCVTLPALALGSVTSKLSDFAWAALTIWILCLTVISTSAGIKWRAYQWGMDERSRELAALALITILSAAIVALQYSRRTRWPARVLGLAATVGAVLVVAFLPREVSARLDCMLDPDPPSKLAVVFDQRTDRHLKPATIPMGGRTVVELPFRVSGMESAHQAYTEQIALKVSNSKGWKWAAERHGFDPGAWWSLDPADRLFLPRLAVSRTQLNGIPDGPVLLEGKLNVRPYIRHRRESLPVEFTRVPIAGLGLCSSRIEASPIGNLHVRVICESTRRIARLTKAILETPGAESATQQLGRSLPSMMRPLWLTPLDRVEAFLVVPGITPPQQRGNISNARVVIEPVEAQGCATVDYAVKLPDLKRWVVN